MNREKKTGILIETGQRTLDDKPPGRPYKCNLRTVRGTDRLEEPSALDLNEVSLSSFGDSILQIAPNAEWEDSGVHVKISNLESVIVSKGWVKAMLAHYSGEPKDLCPLPGYAQRSR